MTAMSQPDAPPARRGLSFSSLLRETREAASQTEQVMALVLNIRQEDYESFEEGYAYPDDEVLRRLCVMMEWNYYDVRRMINNEMATSAAIGRQAPVHSATGGPAQTALTGRKPKGDTLGQRLAEVRHETGQTEEIIAMLLNLDIESYREIENGRPPNDDTLRRMSIIYDWNYQDLMALLRSEQARKVQPVRMAPPPNMRVSPHVGKFRGMMTDLESVFGRLPPDDQQFVLAQLELINETAKRRIA